MAVSQAKSKRSPSGGRYKKLSKKKQRELGHPPTFTKLGKRKLKTIRAMGGNSKLRLLGAESANVYDQKAKSSKKAKIKAVVENPANRHYVRRNIITKGTVIDTDAGKARVISRPAQDGTVNAVLIGAASKGK